MSTPFSFTQSLNYCVQNVILEVTFHFSVKQKESVTIKIDDTMQHLINGKWQG